MLQVLNLSKTFHKGTVNENPVFSRFSLKVNQGDFITIIGSNGAGKSTLLNIISGSIGVDDGSIMIKDKEIARLPEHKRTKMIGRVFQSPSVGTSPSMTILENLSIAYNKGKGYNLTWGISKKNISFFQRVLSELSLGLENRLNTKVGLLSGGQRQALSLLMATISDPELLLLDEHTAALDPKASEIVINLTRKIISERNLTTLMVTHNLNQAIALGNRLLMLHQGRVVIDITGEEKMGLTKEKLLRLFDRVNSDDLLSDRLVFS